MKVADGVSVTGTPRLKRGFVRYPSVPVEGRSLGQHVSNS